MKKYKLIGLTGTTGAGKSQVCKIFESKGYHIVDADLLARKAVENPLVISLLKENFGDDIYANNILNRKLLAQRAFSSKEKTATLNAITHPFITTLFLDEIYRLKELGCNNIVLDAPQLFESKLDALCDRIVAVVAEEKIRIDRIMKRDSITYENAKKRISVQYSQEFFIENCDYIITNNSTLEELLQKTEKILNLLS